MDYIEKHFVSVIFLVLFLRAQGAEGAQQQEADLGSWGPPARLAGAVLRSKSLRSDFSRGLKQRVLLAEYT